MNREVSSQRVFIAIKVYPDIHFTERLGQLRQQLKDEPIRWVKQENLHITIRFIGDCESLIIRDISESLSALAKLQPSFDLTIKGIGVFRSLHHPRVLWAGIEAGPALFDLQKKVDHMLNTLGFKFEADTISPHLTLGRMKRIISRKSLGDLIMEYEKTDLLAQTAESIVFFESVLRNEGPEYFPVSEHFFK